MVNCAGLQCAKAKTTLIQLYKESAEQSPALSQTSTAVGTNHNPHPHVRHVHIRIVDARAAGYIVAWRSCTPRVPLATVSLGRA